MKKKMFKLTSICLVIVMLFSLSSCFALTSCKLGRIQYNIGYFTVEFKNKQAETNPSDTGYSYVLRGLSELGKQQKVIIMPETINGHKYLYSYRKGAARNWYAIFESSNLEKIYIGSNPMSEFYEQKIQFRVCKQLRKVINNSNILHTTYTLCEQEGLTECTRIDHPSFEWVEGEDGIKRLIVKKLRRIANIHFVYNFPEAPNGGYYWIDDIDNGEKVEVKPDTPEREGYTFEGWYTEKECINEFDFNTVFNKPVLEVGDIYPDDYVTYLYAKWIPVEG